MRRWLVIKATLALALIHLILPAVLAQPVLIDFEDLSAGGPGSPALVVNDQYASRGVIFNNPAALDYSLGSSAIPGFAHSGTKALEQCYSKEFCTLPFEMTFTTAQARVKLFIGYSARLTASRTVVLSAFNAAGAQVGTATTTLAPNTSPQPIRMSLEVVSSSVNIARATVGFSPSTTLTNGLAIDDLEFGASLPITVTPASLAFAFRIGGALPAIQTVSVSATAALPFTAASSTSSGGNWLQVSPSSSTTTATLNVSVNPAGLAAGTYSGAIQIDATSATNSPRSVAVTLIVSPPVVLQAPASLSFRYQIGGGTPAAQNASITTPGGSADVTVSVSTASGVIWLTVSPARAPTPVNLMVSVNPVGLAPGIHMGTVTVQESVNSANSVRIPVQFTVISAPPPLIVPKTVTFVFDPASGSLVSSQTFAVTSRTGGPVTFTATPVVVTPQGRNWLAVSQSRNITPATITLTANASGLGRGRYVAYVIYTLQSSGPTAAVGASAESQPPQATTTDLASAATGPFIVSPRSLSLAIDSPSPIPISVTNAGGNVEFLATASPPPPDSLPRWLSVAPANSTTPQTINVSLAREGLGPGDYEGRIAIQDRANSPNGETVRATISIGGPLLRLNLDSGALSFNYPFGGVVPQPVSVGTSSTGAALAYSATAQSEGNWLSVTPASGTTPGPITISVNPGGLGPNVYPGSITVAAADALNGSQEIAVTLTVMPSTLPEVSSVVNAATFATGALAPGSLVSIYGSGLAEGLAEAATIPLPGTLGNTSVTFNGITAPLLFVSPGQINAQLPWNVLPAGSEGGSATVVVNRAGSVSPPRNFEVGRFLPGIFSLGSKQLQALAINVNGSLAAPEGSIPGFRTEPAKIGSTIVVLATGLGSVNPSLENGRNSLDGLRRTTSTPTVLIGGAQARIVFAGMSPEFVGVNQINVEVPDIMPGNNVPIQVQSGGLTTPSQLTIAVQR